MILLWWSTCSSGWAASMPKRASATTSPGSLISFFMECLSGSGQRFRSGLSRSGRGRHWVGEIDPGAGTVRVGRRAGQDAVGQGGQRAGEQLGGEVDRQLAPLDRTTGQLLDQHRPEG